MAAVPVLWLLCSASALATVISSRDAELGEPVISRGGAADSESAAIAMASLCRKAGLQGLTRWVDEHALSISLDAEKLLLSTRPRWLHVAGVLRRGRWTV